MSCVRTLFALGLVFAVGGAGAAVARPAARTTPGAPVAPLSASVSRPTAGDASLARVGSAAVRSDVGPVGSRHDRRRPRARASSGDLMVGVGSRVITPTAYETWNDANGDGTYQPPDETFDDAGIDHLFDYQETGALGLDGQPGKAGIDDDGNGQVDDVGEYLAAGSDDVRDPAGDDYDAAANPEGTEGDGVFQSVAIAGYQGFMGVDIRPMTGVHDDLYARAIAITDGETSMILIEDDLIGLLFQYMNPVKRDLERELGVPFDNIIIASTHTHQGPDTVGIWAGDVDADYMTLIQQQMYDAAVEAWDSRVAVDMRSATANPVACYDKQTLVQSELSECYLADYREANYDSSSAYDQWMLQVDLRDPWVSRMEVPVTQFVAKNGATVATLVNFDDHPEVFLDENTLISSDFPHYVRTELEDQFGGMAIYISGTVGCQMGALHGTPIPLRDENGEPVYQEGIYDAEGNPVPEWANGPENRVRSLGTVIGEYAANAVRDATFSSSPALTVQSDYIDVRIDNPMYKVLIAKIKHDKSFHEWQYLIHADYCTPAGCIRTPIQVVTLGNVTFLTAPGEFPPEYLVGRHDSIAPYSQTDPPYEDYYFPAMPRMRDAISSSEVFWVGLANNYFGYAIPVSDTLPAYMVDHPNYYEEVYDANLCFGDSIGNRLMEMVGSTERFGDCVAYPETGSTRRR